MGQQHLDKPTVINGVYLLGERDAARREGRKCQHARTDMRPQPALVCPLGWRVGKVTIFVVRPSPAVARASQTRRRLRRTPTHRLTNIASACQRTACAAPVHRLLPAQVHIETQNTVFVLRSTPGADFNAGQCRLVHPQCSTSAAPKFLTRHPACRNLSGDSPSGCGEPSLGDGSRL